VSSLGDSALGASFLGAASALTASFRGAFFGFFPSPLGVTDGGGRSPFALNFFLFSFRLLRLANSRSLSRRAILLLLCALIILAMRNHTHAIGSNYTLCRGLSQDLFSQIHAKSGKGSRGRDCLGNALGHTGWTKSARCNASLLDGMGLFRGGRSGHPERFSGATFSCRRATHKS
jgi:hypothetical protein